MLGLGLGLGVRVRVRVGVGLYKLQVLYTSCRYSIQVVGTLY